MSRHDPRSAALAALVAVLARGRKLDDALDEPLRRLAAPRDRAFARELAFGVCRFKPRLDVLATRLLQRPIRHRDTDLAVVVALGLYQLIYLRVPSHAAVSESVALARARTRSRASGLVNAVLRRFERERDTLLAEADLDPVARHAHPRWLLDALAAAWPNEWREIVDANNRPGPMTLRVNALRGTREQARDRLRAGGLDASPGEHSPHALVLDRPVDVQQLPGFAQGALSVQDEAAQLAAALLAPQPAQRVLDACAAPGGKSTHLLEIQPALRELVALERERSRASLLRTSLSRLQLDARIVVGDACSPSAWWDEQPFDRILLDAPCTATGVIRRHPDVKIRRNAGDAIAAAENQLRMLRALWPLLARGGRLLYATCSIMPAENAGVVTAFLGQQPDAQPVVLDARWGRAAGPGRQILPGESGMDGFYYALLAKR